MNERPVAMHDDNRDTPSRDVSRQIIPHALILERAGTSALRTVSFGDSFRYPIMLFLAEHFERILFLDVRNNVFDRAAIESENPDLVIFSVHSFYYANYRNPYRVQEDQAQARALETGGRRASVRIGLEERDEF